MKPIIRVENLSKQYAIGAKAEPYSTFRESLVRAARKPIDMIRGGNGGDKSTFWALKDVSFDVMPGEVVGIIGRNGAGKSTLLKILSRITEPTAGRIELYGRVGSLLEVGTGFHPELTGRENIYLNGAVLGMRREEIAKKFDEIVDFAEIEDFLDTPVKRYSSGMYVRLAFAVAAHLEPEVLIIDEVLAVGDAKFQKKCLGKMETIGKEGRTVLFVSHNMALVRQLCRSVILMDCGSMVDFGQTERALEAYLKMGETSLTRPHISKYGIELRSIKLIECSTGLSTLSPIFGRDYELRLELKTLRPLREAAVVMRVLDQFGNRVSSICSFEEGLEPFFLEDRRKLTFSIPSIQLFPGEYSISLIVSRPNDRAYFEVDRCFVFEVQPAVIGQAPWPYHGGHGVVRISDGCILE